MRHFLLKLLGLYSFLLVTFCLCLFCTNNIGHENIRQNVLESGLTLKDEGYYPRIIEKNPFTRLDNFTDSWMIGLCYPDTSLSPFENIFYSSFYSPRDSVNDTEHIDGLLLVGENSFADITPGRYERYWHGYEVTLKPLLCYFNYAQIRIINAILLYGLVIWTLVLIWLKRPRICFWAFLSTLCVGLFFVIPYSLQYSTCFYITFLGTIALLSFPYLSKTIYRGALSFFAIGAVTSYLDFLTTPLLTLCIPGALILYNQESTLKKTILWSISWGAGYLSLWSSKWLLAYLLVRDKGIWSNAFDAVANRTVGSTVHDSIMLDSFTLAGIVIILALALISITYWYGRHKRKIDSFKNHLYLMVFTLWVPLWYLLLHNHTTDHIAFTWRLLLIPFFCGLLFIFAIFFSHEDRSSNTML